MNDERPNSVPPQAAVDSEPNITAAPRPRRLWPGCLLIAIYWAIWIAAGQAELPITTTFFIVAGTSALLTLLFVIWWLTNRTIAGRDRLLVLGAVVLGGAAAIAASKETLGAFSAIFIGLPWVLTAWIVWSAIARRASGPVFRWGAVAAVCLPWIFVSLIKVTGITGDMKSDMHWRWTPTAEETYIATRSETAAEQPADTAAAPDEAEAIVAAPDDWPGFRGPSRNGEVHGLSIGVDWKQSPPTQLWRQKIGPGWSSMAVVGGRLFTQEQVGEKEVVVCLDARTGKRLWSHEDAARLVDSQGGPGPRATPQFVAGDLYTQGATGILNCLNAANGRLKWSRDIAKDAAAPLPMWGFSSSPLVIGDVVVTYAGGKGDKGLLAYHTTDGSPAWSVATGAISYSSPQPITPAGETQVVIVSDAGILAVEPASGDIAWRFEANGQGVWRAAQPTEQEDGSLLIGSEDLGTVCLDLRKVDGEWQPRERYRSNKLRPSFDDFVLYQGCAYGFDLRVFCCFDTKTGKPRWRGGRYGNGQVLLLRDQGLLLISAESGEVVLAAASPQGHRELARMQAIEGKTWNHQAIANGNLFVRNDQEITCYRLPPPGDEMAAK